MELTKEKKTEYKERRREYYLRHKDEILEKSRLYKKSHPRPAEYYREYRRKHPEKIRKYSEKWRNKNPDYNKHYYEQYKERMRNNMARYLANLKNQAYSLLGGYECVGCGERQKEVLSIDHIYGGGTAHRKKIGGSGIHKAVVDDPDAKKKYRILCMNCQFRAKSRIPFPNKLKRESA